MGFTQDIINETSIPSNIRDNAKNCIMCGKEVKIGGYWATDKEMHLFSVCNSELCIKQHATWLIDVFLSDGKSVRDFETKDKFMEFMEERYNRSASHERNK